MLSKEEIEKAKSNILRGNDIESACLIMEEVIWNKLVIFGGRVNIVKVAMRQILNFIEEYKEKGYLDVLKEIVQLKEKNNQLEQENKRQNKMIDEMTEFIVSSAVVDDTVCSRIFCNEEGNCSYKKQKKCTKQYFEKKVEEKNVKN